MIWIYFYLWPQVSYMFSGLVALTVRNKRKNKQLIDCKQKYRMLVLELFPYELATTFLHNISNHKVNLYNCTIYISNFITAINPFGLFRQNSEEFFPSFAGKAREVSIAIWLSAHVTFCYLWYRSCMIFRVSSDLVWWVHQHSGYSGDIGVIRRRKRRYRQRNIEHCQQIH